MIWLISAGIAIYSFIMLQMAGVFYKTGDQVRATASWSMVPLALSGVLFNIIPLTIVSVSISIVVLIIFRIERRK